MAAADWSCAQTHYAGAPWWLVTPSAWWYFLIAPGYSFFLSLRQQQPIWRKETVRSCLIPYELVYPAYSISVDALANYGCHRLCWMGYQSLFGSSISKSVRYQLNAGVCNISERRYDEKMGLHELNQLLRCRRDGQYLGSIQQGHIVSGTLFLSEVCFADIRCAALSSCLSACSSSCLLV